jgi:hypothetical protein
MSWDPTGAANCRSQRRQSHSPRHRLEQRLNQPLQMGLRNPNTDLHALVEALLDPVSRRARKLALKDHGE